MADSGTLCATSVQRWEDRWTSVGETHAVASEGSSGALGEAMPIRRPMQDRFITGAQPTGMPIGNYTWR